MDLFPIYIKKTLREDAHSREWKMSLMAYGLEKGVYHGVF